MSDFIYAVQCRMGEALIQKALIASATPKQIRLKERLTAWGFKLVLDKERDARLIAYSEFDAIQNFLGLEQVVIDRASREIAMCKQRMAAAERLLIKASS